MFSPYFCEYDCPICTNARAGVPLAVQLQDIEKKVTNGGCPFCKARMAKFGVTPDQPLPEDVRASVDASEELQKYRERRNLVAGALAGAFAVAALLHVVCRS